jgi:hypothetical protein
MARYARIALALALSLAITSAAFAVAAEAEADENGGGKNIRGVVIKGAGGKLTVRIGSGGGAAGNVTAKRDSVSQYGITWTFDKPVMVGQFVNGDYYVVGPVTVVKITPEPIQGPEAKGDGDRDRKDGLYARNGSELNLPARDKVGFDSRQPLGRYDPKLFAKPPFEMKPGDSLVSTISVEKAKVAKRMMRPGSVASCPNRTAAVLTCLAAPAPKDAFRPSLHDKTNKLYLARNLRRELLPSVKIPEAAKKGRRGVDVLHKVRAGSWDQTDASIWIRVFQRPWIDVSFDGLTSPVENMPQYGREIARAAGSGALLLCCDIPKKDKEKLLINMVQTGIDLWGAVQDGHHGWPAHGGHGHGRKLLIVLAGFMLNDADMMSPKRKYPNVKFSEDMQTVYGKCWTGARVMYGGHVGAGGLKGKVGWGLYEDKHPKDWPAKIGESYRRCCLGHCWVAEAMAIRFLKMETVWNHPAFLDYIDRWMNEDDAEHVKTINKAKGWDFSAAYLRQGSSWDVFATEMYRTYRPQFGPMNWQSEK